MEVGSQEFRVMIFYDFRRGLGQAESLANLNAAFGDEAPSRAMVFRWFAEFKRGRRSFEDEPRSGRPSTAVTEDNVGAVRSMLQHDRRITNENFQNRLSVGSAAVNTILHDHLGVTRRCARWVPHQLSDEQRETRVRWCQFMIRKFNDGRSRNLPKVVTGDETWIYQHDPETKQQSTVWLFPGEDPPVKFKRTRSVGKQMVASFFSMEGHVATVPLVERRTVNAEWYTGVCLPHVFQKWSEKHPRTGLQGLLLHHDNASAHTSAVTLDFLTENGVQLVSHPAYSPDLAPCDWFLFPYVKSKLRGTHFPSPEEARIEFERVISGIPSETWREVFVKWFHRMHRCVETGGGYFEKA